MENSFAYGIDRLTSGIALKLCRGQINGVLSDEAIERIKKSEAIVSSIVEKGDVVYGINTGFGPLCNTRISSREVETLQHNLLKSHSVGVGDPISKQVSRLMLILKVHALAQGLSGISLETVQRIIWHISEDVIPVVPSQGSVGASGDLAPLAHLFLPLIGLGYVQYQNKVIEAGQVLNKHGMGPLTLKPKEGLALINGTQFISAFSVLIVEKFHNCLLHADLISAMMVDGLLASQKPFMPELHQTRPYRGNMHVAKRILGLLNNSEINNSHEECDRVQDPYSLRCIPQVHGTSREAWLHLKNMVEIEINSITDNPVIINRELIISGGNFHGQPLALPLDYATLGASELGNISDRRTYLSLIGITERTPKLLMKNTGVNSAFMILQYTTAALVSENKSLCYPASADSIPTSLGQEDHVSMGSISARKAIRVCENLEKILAIEMICAAQAIDFQRPLKSGPLVDEVQHYIRQEISHAEEDRIFADDISKAIHIIQSKKLIDVIERYVGKHPESNINTEYDELYEFY